MSTQRERLRIGQLAERTGLSVRTLRYYDEIGLLEPARRTRSGYRLYGREQVERLGRIVSLRQLGFSLDEIRECLRRPAFSLERTLRLHIARLEEEVERAGRLKKRLEGIARRLGAEERISMREMMAAIKEARMYEEYYTTEQRAQLEERGRAVGEARIQEVQAEWAELFEAFGREMERGADPSDDEVQALARKARALIEEFTGGDAGIRASLGRMVSDNRDAMYERWGVDPEVAAYMGRAMVRASADEAPGA